MPARSRTFLAALTASLVVTATLTPALGGAAAASGNPATPSLVAVASSGARISLASDEVVPHGGARAAAVRRWKGGTLRYYDSLPAKWDWSLSTAVAKWNDAGGRIRLARTGVPGQAQVRIGYANIGSAAGLATVGATSHAFVRLSSRFSSMDAVNAHNRVTIMNVLAHELGHVLGFQHTAARCSLMSPVIDVDACNVVPTSQPGYYKCRTLDTALVQRFIRLYGGRARYPSAAWCLIDPLPRTLSGVSFTGGGTSPVTVRWNRPTSVLAGSMLQLRRWQASTCGTAPSWAATFRPSLTAGVWQDQVTYQDEKACFSVRVVNRYGAGPPAQSRVLARWVPALGVPAIGAPSYDVVAERFTFTASVPSGTTLRARWDIAHPSVCVTSPSGGTSSAYVSVINGHGSLTSPTALPQCVTFFAYDAGTNRVSKPVFVTLAVPPPEIGDVTWDPVAHVFRAPASHATGTHLVSAVAVDPTTCPGGYAGGQAVAADSAGAISFATPRPDQCVSLYAVDDLTGLASAPTQVHAHAPLPTEAPTVGPITILEKNFYPWFQAEFAGLATGDHIGYAVLAGRCPESAPTIALWRSQLQDSGTQSPGREDYGLFPSAAAGDNCLVATSLDWFGWSGTRSGDGTAFAERHGPVVMRNFVDDGPLPPSVGTPVWNAGSGQFQITVSATRGLHAIYDRSDPTTCPAPGTTGILPVAFQQSGDRLDLTPPVSHSCVTFYNDAGEGPVPVSAGTPVELTVPTG